MTDLIKTSWFGKLLVKLGSNYKGYAKAKDRMEADQLIKKKMALSFFLDRWMQVSGLG